MDTPKSSIFGPFEKLVAEWGLNAIAGWLAFTGLVGVVLVALTVDFPFFYMYNDGWRWIIVPTNLIIAIAMTVSIIPLFFIAAFTPSVRAAVMNSTGMSERKLSSSSSSRRSKEVRFLNVESGVVGAMVAYIIAAFVLWGFAAAPTGIFVSYWNKPGTTTYLEDATFGGVNLPDDLRSGYVFVFGVYYLNLAAVIHCIMSLMIAGYYATHTSPLMFLNELRNTANQAQVFGKPT